MRPVEKMMFRVKKRVFGLEKKEDIACGVPSGEGCFSYSVIHAYLRSGSLSCRLHHACKADKLALRKRAKFFIAKD